MRDCQARYPAGNAGAIQKKRIEIYTAPSYIKNIRQGPCAPGPRGDNLAKKRRNPYESAKRQKELERKKKKELKKEQRLHKSDEAEEAQEGAAEEGVTEENAAVESTAEGTE
jgi:hypothetical protein